MLLLSCELPAARVTARCGCVLLQLLRAVAVKAHWVTFGLACGGIWFDRRNFAAQNSRHEMYLDTA
jgi:hypothetical protein